MELRRASDAPHPRCRAWMAAAILATATCCVPPIAAPSPAADVTAALGAPRAPLSAGVAMNLLDAILCSGRCALIAQGSMEATATAVTASAVVVSVPVGAVGPLRALRDCVRCGGQLPFCWRASRTYPVARGEICHLHRCRRQLPPASRLRRTWARAQADPAR